MSYQLERKLIETRFKAGMPEGSPIQYGNLPFQPDATGFFRISLLGGGASGLLALTGGAQQRSSGVIDVGIFVPRDTGTDELRTLADQVHTALAHQDLSEGAVRIVTFGSRFVDLGPAGEWHQASVEVRYQRDSA